MSKHKLFELFELIWNIIIIYYITDDVDKLVLLYDINLQF